ncbi:GTP-binding protein HSR1 [Rhodovastum atsumiense]|uniref:GTPase family protein n=1 Tax=Rhodovastum atsumiense TaxID=504468 RepID=UPI00139F2BF9|nr:GTPase domain-containing protein [Rhodovastum atsumiense]CAH2600114.1 GTP-binding protein HSR1 [Rhodovastum atsumiense]
MTEAESGKFRTRLRLVWRGLVANWREVAVAFCLVVPQVVLLVLGLLWLFSHGVMLVWLGFAAACAGVAALLLRRLRAGDVLPAPPPPHPDSAWGPRERAAWEKVQDFITRTPAFSEDTDAARASVTALVEEIARHYGPDAAEPLARFTVPEALLLAERTARRLRVALLQAVPFSHAVTVSTALWWYRRRGLIDLAAKAYDVYRVFRPVVNPLSAVFGELREHVTQDVMAFGAERLRRTITRLVLEETGRGAIDLYSGRLRIDEAKFEAARAGTETTAPPPGPPRILLAGQVNAGKSSLANALAGELRAVATPVPGPEAALVLDVAAAGRPTLRLVDAPGLRGEPGEAEALASLAAQADLVLWVSAANSAARHIDTQALAALRATLAQDRALDPPPLLLAVPHIDRLPPFAEWAPPYDIARPATPKARRIHDAVAAIGADLAIAEADIVPVCLDARKGLYNVDLVWALIAARLEQAQTRQLQRAFAESRQGLDLAQVLRQATTAGRALFSALR